MRFLLDLTVLMILWRRLVQTKILHQRLFSAFATTTATPYSTSSYHQMPPKFFPVVPHHRDAAAAAVASTPLSMTSMMNGHGPEESFVRIDFDDNELQLFAFLRNVVQAYEESKIGASLPNAKQIAEASAMAATIPGANTEPSLMVRIAGGWVRDKLLGISSDDVDLAVNHFTGVQFAGLLQEYHALQLQQQQQQDDVVVLEISSMGVVAANPSQSKHLETVCMRIGDIDVDILHLRSQEVYKDDSRIPDVEFGTALDDAERRDFTINTLFYNIHTNMVEDWTGRGWDDMQNGLIVTPLDPATTFLDDPLRVLRAIRFAVRYHYALTPACRATIQRADVRTAFATKVSRERVGKELEGMLSGKKAHPFNAIKTIYELHLSSLVFMLPPEITTPVSDEEWRRGLDYASGVTEMVQNLHQQADGDDDVGTTTTTPSCTNADLRLLPLLSFLLPVRNLVYPVKKNKERPVIEYIVKESIKFKAKDGQDAVTAYAVLDRMMDLLQGQVYSNRLTIGLLLREAKQIWVTALVLAALLRNDDAAHYVEAYRCMKAMDQCWNAKPLLDGQSLMQELGIPKGPDVGKAMQAQVEWMLEHPDGTRERCVEYLRQQPQQRKRQAEEVISK